MDFSQSGIYWRIGVELIDVRNVNKSKGWFSGKVVGGKITEDFNSDYRASATLEIDGGEIPLGVAVRIWAVAEDGAGDTQRIELGTFWPDPASMDYDHGRYHGSVELHSAMKRLGTDLRSGDGSVAKGSVVVEKFAKYVKNSGGVPAVKSSVSKTKKLAKAHVWKHGESVLEECQRLADSLGAWIGVDTHGRVTLEPYVKPKKRAVSYTVPRGVKSMVEVGTLGYESPEIYNRFIASYENSVKVQEAVGTYQSNVKYTENVKDKNGNIIHRQGEIRHHSGDTKYKTKTVKKKYCRSLQVPNSHPWSFSKLGRWYTYDCGSPTIAHDSDSSPTEAQVEAALEKHMKDALAEHADYRRTWSATMLYDPKVQVGKVIDFYYSDNPDAPAVSRKCFVSAREITLNQTMKMELTLEAI